MIWLFPPWLLGSPGAGASTAFKRQLGILILQVPTSTRHVQMLPCCLEVEWGQTHTGCTLL
jgi:hypothetical protein